MGIARTLIKAPIQLSAVFLRNFQQSPTAERILLALLAVEIGARLLNSAHLKQSEYKTILSCLSEAYLIDMFNVSQSPDTRWKPFTTAYAQKIPHAKMLTLHDFYFAEHMRMI